MFQILSSYTMFMQCFYEFVGIWESLNHNEWKHGKICIKIWWTKGEFLNETISNMSTRKYVQVSIWNHFFTLNLIYIDYKIWKLLNNKSKKQVLLK